jgi:transcriptional regulator with XRE-family HTH domain
MLNIRRERMNRDWTQKDVAKQIDSQKLLSKK